MPTAPAHRNASRLPSGRLLALTAAVALGHIAILQGLPAGIGFLSGHSDDQNSAALTASFVTRTVTPEPEAVPQHKPIRKEPKAVEPAPHPFTPPSPDSALTGAAPVTDAVTRDASQTTAGPELPVAAPDKAPEPTTTLPASPLAAATAASAAAEVQLARKVNYAEPVRLQFDGRGEEGGYKKYAAGGELLWQPQAMQYTAKLEITALFFRIRTWTSKGELTEGGLQPLRFGDKPRGAEQATHFQRDKGIISFSANNPDVPLQPGAQDKLSALLQLSAMVAGEPEQYPSGASIRFQAADAHRAELWNFKAGATESLDLPGGTLSTVKFTKDPTVEFDQRVEVWLASTMRYLPVRIRVTESNGNFVDLLWRSTEKPE